MIAERIRALHDQLMDFTTPNGDPAYDALRSVVELHAPVDRPMINASRPVCEGCDLGSYDAEPPEWPCTTIDVIVTAGSRRGYWRP